MCRVVTDSNTAGTSIEQVSGDDIGKMETNLVTVKHRRDSADPPKGTYRKYEVPGGGSGEGEGVTKG